MTAVASPAVSRPGVTQPRVLHSEWIKLRSVRSTWFSFGAAMLVSIGLGTLFSSFRGHDAAQHHVLDLDATQISLRGIFLAQLAVGVLGVLLITGEYATGMIRASLAAVPRRVPVLIAKAGVFGLVTFLVSTAMSLIAFLSGQAVLSGDHLGVSLASPGAARAVLGGGLYLTIVGLLGLGCGFAIRSTGGAIATLFGLILVLPLLAQALPSSWQDHIDKYLPMNAGTAILSTRPESNMLGPWAGIGVFALYAVAALAVGWIVLRRRDA
jgi:ABC-2 type transport system permease protein